VGMGGRMTVGRVVAAADVPALEADAEVKPGRTDGEAVHASIHLLGQLRNVDAVEVGARVRHGVIKALLR
jgi:hypothetical protein